MPSTPPAKTPAKQRLKKRSKKRATSSNKTVATKASPSIFLKQLDDSQVRADCKTLARIMRNATGKRAKMWGESIVGFGEYHYQYESGRQGDFMVTGFAPRKNTLTIYIMPGFSTYGALLKKLGKHKTTRSCLYIKRLSDVNEKVLAQIIERSVRDMKAKYVTNLR